MAGVNEIIFAARKLNESDGHWYANLGYYAHDPNRKAWREGTKLYRWNVATGKLTTLLDDPRGGVRDPQVHYDGTKILFSYRKGGTEQYHLYEMNADGTGLRQLTDGLYDDIEPTYLPDGDIVFVSTRCKRWVNCWLTQVAIMYRCDANGQNIRPISSNNEQDNTPWPLPDGRLLYTRWEYVDRSQVHYHHLWAANPDGTAQMTWYGNLHPGTVMIDAKPIPGSDKVVASFSPGHGQPEHAGQITIVDPSAGPDAQSFARPVSRGNQFRDPWAFSENCFMAALGHDAGSHGRHRRAAGNLQAARGRPPGRHATARTPPPPAAAPRAHHPRPRQIPGPPPAAWCWPTSTTAATWPASSAARSRSSSCSKPCPCRFITPAAWNRSATAAPSRSNASSAPCRSRRTARLTSNCPPCAASSSSRSTRTTFPSSACRASSPCSPARRPVASAATSSAPKRRGPPTMQLAALRRAPSRIEPIADVPDVIDFPRDIQPVLDALCVSCHGYEKTAAGGPRAGRLILTGDHGPLYSHSYYMLTIARLISDGRNQPRSNYAPRTLGSSASRLLTLLDGTHYGVKATPLQKKLLRLWIDSGAAYPGTYAALGCGMIGNYAENAGSFIPGTTGPPPRPPPKVIQKRCAACHAEPARLLPQSLADERGVSFWQPSLDDPRLLTSRHIVFNLSRPEQSLILLAPLAESAGGWGLCRDPKTRERVTVFADKADPGYQALLALCVAGKEALAQGTRRFDMPDFRPRADWVREMKRYGILPADGEPRRPPRLLRCGTPVLGITLVQAYRLGPVS